MSTTLTVEKIENGYLLKTQHGLRTLYADTAQTLFTQILRELEGKSPHLGGDAYAKVTVEYEKPEEKTQGASANAFVRGHHPEAPNGPHSS